MKLRWRRFDLPLRHVFTIARGSMSVCRTLIVEIEHDGVCGYGEAGENPYYHADLDTMIDTLAGLRPEIESAKPVEPTELWQRLAPRLRGDTFVRSALDTAAWDLWGKLHGQPVRELLAVSISLPEETVARELPPSDYTIGIDAVDVMIAKLEEMPGWPVYKIKLGTADDIEIVRRLRERTDANLRVDANCGWTADAAIRNAAVLAELGVEYIEQPLPPDNRDGMREVYAQSVLPIIADESCQVATDVDGCRGLFHGVNVKLVKCGGLTPAVRMLARARQLGMKTMVGCMTETTVGISAAAQLLPLVDYADLDGALLLAEDCATGVTVDRGRVTFPRENGCGVRLL